jgi:co-chaperonin GroES (HSP10)
MRVAQSSANHDGREEASETSGYDPRPITRSNGVSYWHPLKMDSFGATKEKPQEGTVAAVGTGKLDDNGKKIEFIVKVGDKVLISKYGGTEIKIDGENYLIMREDDILGIIG